jgi:hypothetical protein
VSWTNSTLSTSLPGQRHSQRPRKTHRHTAPPARNFQPQPAKAKPSRSSTPAAHCHLRLGNVEYALSAYISLAETLPQDDPLEPLLLDVRCEIALLQEMTGHPEALESLANLYPLLDKHHGRDAHRTTQVREALNRAAASSMPNS